MNEPIHPTRCQDHLESLPCARCDENNKRGYEVLMLAGRCANGSELDHGTKWHAVRKGNYQAVCGAKPGRRSAGWSSYTVLGQPATCPRCLKKLTINVDALISKRNKLTNRRDGLTDWSRVKRIDDQLAQVAPGENNEIDRALGRPCATLTPRPDYNLTAALLASELPADVEAVAADRADWIQQGIANGAALKATLPDAHEGWFVNPACRLWGAHEWKPESIADQTADYNAHMAQYGAEIVDDPKDWRDLLSGD